MYACMYVFRNLCSVQQLLQHKWKFKPFFYLGKFVFIYQSKTTTIYPLLINLFNKHFGKFYIVIIRSEINHNDWQSLKSRFTGDYKKEGDRGQSKAPMKVAKRYDNIALSIACDHCPYRPHRLTNNECTNRDGNWKKNLPKADLIVLPKRSHKNINKT